MNLASHMPSIAQLQAAAAAAMGHPPDQAREWLLHARQQGWWDRLPDLHFMAANLLADCPAQRLQHLNAAMSLHGLKPLVLQDNRSGLISRNLAVASPPQTVSVGAQVTVLMTTHNCAGLVAAAIASVLSQTWQPLQLIVVDDASTDDTFNVVQSIARTDDRVQAIRLPHNLGPYGAKMIGLQLAKGEFVTCHDADDWSHPEKIERQVRPLLEQPELVATASCWVRVTDEGLFYSRQGFPFTRWNPSSPLFRRELVLRQAGGWDVVRTGADSEFYDRLKHVFGPKRVLRLSEPLTIGSHRAGSLMTAPDTGYDSQGRSPARQAHMAAWKVWHQHTLARGTKPWVPVHPVMAAKHRAFSAPDALRVDPAKVQACLDALDLTPPATLERPCMLVRSEGLVLNPTLPALLGAEVVKDVGDAANDRRVLGVAGWGNKASTQRAAKRAEELGLPFHRLEDGFLRSMWPGEAYPPLSLVVDGLGIYYDATQPSALERVLNSDEDLLAGPASADVQRARALMQCYGLSKYNHGPPLWLAKARAGKTLLRPDDRQRVLLVDQTAGDMSIAYAQACADTFAQMLQAALYENPDATVYVKTHPQTAAGQAGGHYADLAESERVVPLREPIEPLSLLRQVDAVYVVSSTLGFEALLAGKPVHCFGLPWYSGWGVTHDRLRCERRTRTRTVDELFAAAYLRYARYLNPETHERGTIFDVIAWLARQRRMAGLLQDAPADS